MKILIVDDELFARKAIRAQLDTRFEISESSNYIDAVDKLSTEIFDMCFLDLRLDSSEKLLGLDLIPLTVNKGIYTVVMTSIEDDSITEIAYGRGCQDVYNKGNEKNHISETISRYFISKDSFTEGHFFKDIIPTMSPAYKQDLKRLLKIIPTDFSICLLGETGTGKSRLARSIHEISKKSGPFIEINCPTFSGDTLKTELFGYKKGAFTGANEDTVGKLEAANGGTIFFDEIGSMPIDMQEQLLKVIEEQSFYPVGSNKLVKINVRVICATCEDLQLMVQKKKFRLDLYHRIAGFSFTQPSLRNRKEDIQPLLQSALKLSRKIVIKTELRKAIEEYSWPGNIRQLLRFADLISLSNSGIVKLEEFQTFTHNSVELKEANTVEDHYYDRIKEIGLNELLDEFTLAVVKRALKENPDSAKSIAALKISKSAFYRHLDKEIASSIAPKNETQSVSYEIQ